MTTLMKQLQLFFLSIGFVLNIQPAERSITRFSQNQLLRKTEREFIQFEKRGRSKIGPVEKWIERGEDSIRISDERKQRSIKQFQLRQFENLYRIIYPISKDQKNYYKDCLSRYGYTTIPIIYHYRSLNNGKSEVDYYRNTIIDSDKKRIKMVFEAICLNEEFVYNSHPLFVIGALLHEMKHRLDYHDITYAMYSGYISNKRRFAYSKLQEKIADLDACQKMGIEGSIVYYKDIAQRNPNEGGKTHPKNWKRARYLQTFIAAMQHDERN